MVQQKKLSDAQLRQLIAAGKPIAKADGGGLTFSLSAAGAARWVLRYRFGGRPREYLIGSYPDLPLSKAREKAARLRVDLLDGIDPGVERVRDKAGREQAFRSLALDYMEKRFPDLAPATQNQRRAHIEKLILPKLGALPVKAVTAEHVVAVVESVGKRSKHVAELCLTAISEIFKHGMAKRAVVFNPAVGISVSAICGKAPAPRARLMLSEDELRATLPTLHSMGPENALATKILLATAARIGELTRARWAEVDFEHSTWTIPEQNSKTGRAFVVPLAPQVLQWFRDLHTLACGSDLVMPARQVRRTIAAGGPTFCEQRALNSALRKLVVRLNTGGVERVRRFTPHDLRSTARSWFTSDALGGDVLVAERSLNHSLGGLVAIYDRGDYLKERRSLLNSWAKLLEKFELGEPLQETPKSDAAAPAEMLV